MHIVSTRTPDDSYAGFRRLSVWRRPNTLLASVVGHLSLHPEGVSILDLAKTLRASVIDVTAVARKLIFRHKIAATGNTLRLMDRR